MIHFCLLFCFVIAVGMVVGLLCASMCVLVGKPATRNGLDCARKAYLADEIEVDEFEAWVVRALHESNELR